MVAARELRTQTSEFWRDEFQVSTSDLDLVTGVILESAMPKRIEELAATIILSRLRHEKEAASQLASRGQVYRPADEYAEGESLVFTALDFASGKVIGARPGENPKYDSFQVIKVAFDDGGEREFAAGLDIPHPLNRPLEELLVGGADEIDEAEVVRRHEHQVATRLETTLEKSGEFVWFNGSWFLSALLPEVHIGYLNLAEAMIYEAGHPLAARNMLHELELEGTGGPDAQLFALNHALASDDRFDDVGLGDEPAWYLIALEPPASVEAPSVLLNGLHTRGGEYIGLTMLDLVEEIGDELDDVQSIIIRDKPTIGFEVCFPHLYAGTIPATHDLLRLMPGVDADRFPVTMVDANNGNRFEAFVVPKLGYIAGFTDWYLSGGMRIGGQVTVQPLEEPLTFEIAAVSSKSRRSEWVRSAAVIDGELRLQMQRTTVPVRCDRNMLIDVPDMDAIAEYMSSVPVERSVAALVREAFEELAKLSGKGFVHAKALYSLVNMIHRSSAVRLFAELTKSAAFDPVGDGFWAYDVSLEGKHYATPDDMRDRPLSNREERLRDQVVQYLGR